MMVIWTALLEVELSSSSNPTTAQKGAFVNVIGLGTDESAFRLAIQKAVGDLGAILLKVGDVERFDQRVAKGESNETLLNAATFLSPESPVAFDSFYAYPIS